MSRREGRRGPAKHCARAWLGVKRLFYCFIHHRVKPALRATLSRGFTEVAVRSGAVGRERVDERNV
jgi:hypothetical protein